MKNYLVLLAILILAYFVRLYRIEDNYLSFDECASIGCSMGIPYAGINQVKYSTWDDLGIGNVIFTSHELLKKNNLQNVYKSTLQDNGSILYFSSLHFWIKAFGVSRFSVRYLSLIFSLLTVLILFFISLELTKSENVSLLAVFLFSINQLSIASAQFCRSHSMAGFFTVLATLVLLKILKNKQIDYLKSFVYGLLMVSSMLCHYFTIYIFIGHSLILIFTIREKASWQNYIFGSSIGGLFFTIWLFVGGFEGLKIVSIVHEQFLALAKNYKPGGNAYYIPANLNNISGGCLQTLMPLFGNYFQNFGFRLLNLIPLFSVIFIFVTFVIYRTIEKDEVRKIFIFIGSLIFAQQLWSTAISIKMGYTIFFITSYSQYVAPYCALLLAYAFWLAKNFLSKNLLIMLLIYQVSIELISDLSIYFPINKVKDFNYEKINQQIEQRFKKGDVVITNNWNDGFLLSIHLKNKNTPQKIEINNSNSRTILLINPTKTDTLGYLK